MQAVMIFLYADKSADIRNYGSVSDALNVSKSLSKSVAGMIHVGDIWPEIGALFKLLHNHSGSLLITEDALRQSKIEFDNIENISTYYESQTHRPVAVFSIVQPDEQRPVEQNTLSDNEAVSDQMEAVVEQQLAEVEKGGEYAGITDPFTLLQQAPDWLMLLKISQLVQLTGRLENHFLAHDVNTVADILQYDAEAMLRWPGFGKKSLTDLCQILRASFQAYMRANDTDYLFCHTLRDTMNLLDEKERMVFEKRFGFHCETMTLEQVGKSEGVTRERIRQIEAKAIQKMRACPLWSLNMVEAHLKHLLQDRDSPLLLQDLDSEDKWFVDFSATQECLADLIELFTDHAVSVLELSSGDVISNMNAETWQQQLNDVLSWVKEKENCGLSKADILSFIKTGLERYQAGELVNELYQCITDKLYFSTVDEDAVLVSVGQGYIALVLSVLRSIPIPMHFREITLLCQQIDSTIDERRVQSVLIEHACLYAPGTYGLKEHLPFTEDEIERLKDHLADIIFSGDPALQWNCQVLAEQLQLKYRGTPAHVDKYIVDIVLGDVTRLKNLGRLIWVRTDRDASSARRIDIQEMATDILRQSGRPMPIGDIKTEISKKRGVGEFFLLKTTDHIARVSKAVWGVVDRDFILNRDEIYALLNILYEGLQHKQRYIHMQEIRSTLLDMGYDLAADVTEYMVMSISGTDERFYLSKGQMLGLSDWPDELREPNSDVEYSLVGKSGTVDLVGSKVVLTGTFQSMRRKDIKTRLEALGVTVIDKISADTDHLIAGKGVQFNSKYKTAQASGLPILSEENMLSFFREHYRGARVD